MGFSWYGFSDLRGGFAEIAAQMSVSFCIRRHGIVMIDVVGLGNNA